MTAIPSVAWGRITPYLPVVAESRRAPGPFRSSSPTRWQSARRPTGGFVRSGTPPAFRLTGVKRLYLLRHAKSSWSDPSLADEERPLAPRGRKAAKKMAKELRRREIRPKLVLCSSSRRTQETLELIGSSLGDPTIEVEEGPLRGRKRRAARANACGERYRGLCPRDRPLSKT